ncbi:MAG: NAD(P)H-dependent oxidoreductase [Candidatus Peribacteraceae bacterium]|nr:NAD(P)H-dependent oxidoreductase [Candidatus Peribacteraceae bacterium]
MKILALVAGMNEPSNSDTLADAFLAGIKQRMNDAIVEKIRLKAVTLEQFSLKHYDPAAPVSDDFPGIEKRMKEVHGIVIASPVWNFSVPAHLKNLLDRMGSFAMDERKAKGALNGKPFYLLFTGGAPAAAWNGLLKRTTSHVGQSIRYFGGSVLGEHFEGRCTLGAGKFGLVLDKRPAALKAVAAKGAVFAKAVERYAATGNLPMTETILVRTWKFVQGFAK